MNDRVFSEYLVLYLTNLKESSQDGFGLIIIKIYTNLITLFLKTHGIQIVSCRS